MHWKTRLFARQMKRAAVPYDQIEDFPAHRARRTALQKSLVGGFIFGREARSVRRDEILVAGRRALVHRPDRSGPLPVVVNFHGGGWVQGSPEQTSWLAAQVAECAGALVISPTYRLAPENTYPAAVDDAWAALCWVGEHADELGVDPARIVVMGDSAGANLAAILALRARDEAGPRIRAQILAYPVADMYEVYPSEITHAEAPILTAADMRALVRIYLADQFGTTSSAASPIRAKSHEGLPPTLIVTAQVDVLRDHGVQYGKRLADAGTSVRFSSHPDTVHGFLSIPGVVPAARDARDDIVAFIRASL